MVDILEIEDEWQIPMEAHCTPTDQDARAWDVVLRSHKGVRGHFTLTVEPMQNLRDEVMAMAARQGIHAQNQPRDDA